MIIFIAAIDIKRGIANDNGIPWQGKIPTDVAHFRSKTIGHSVMMGAGWYAEQIKPLPNRRNLVTTNSPESLRPGFEKITDAREFLIKSKEDIWVGGGAGLFASTFDLCDRLNLTILDRDFECTKFFPEFKNTFTLKSQSEPIKENGITYRFTIWDRK